MPANIHSMAYTNQTPWHGLGHYLDPNTSIEEWAHASGLDWTVESSPVYYRAGDVAKVAAKKKVLYRSDKPEVVLGVVSDQFNPVQPAEAWGFFSDLSDKLDIQMETAGILQDGATYWALARTGDSVTIGDSDRVDDYLLLSTANDGSMSTRIGPNSVRVVCQNTLSVALAENAKMKAITHRSKVNWADMRRWIEGEHRNFEIFGNLSQELADIQVDQKQAVEFAAKLLAPEWEGSSEPPRKLKKFLSTLQRGRGQAEAGRTAWGLLNGVTRYVDHEKQARSQESRLNSAWFGAGASLKNAAFDLLIKQCTGEWGYERQLQPVLRDTRAAA